MSVNVRQCCWGDVSATLLPVVERKVMIDGCIIKYSYIMKQLLWIHEMSYHDRGDEKYISPLPFTHSLLYLSLLALITWKQVLTHNNISLLATTTIPFRTNIRHPAILYLRIHHLSTYIIGWIINNNKKDHHRPIIIIIIITVLLIVVVLVLPVIKRFWY